MWMYGGWTGSYGSHGPGSTEDRGDSTYYQLPKGAFLRGLSPMIAEAKYFPALGQAVYALVFNSMLSCPSTA